MKKADLLKALDEFEQLVEEVYEPSELEEDEDCQAYVDRNVEAIDFFRKLLGKQ